MIEPLESRIAPASAINPTTATFIDVDGDLVTIKFSKPIAQQVLYTTTFGAPSIPGAEQLIRLDLGGVTPAAAEGVNITITAVPKDANADGIKDGDGRVNIGELRAYGIHLGAVSMRGDLGQINAGDYGTTVPALKSLAVDSLGEYGLATGAASLSSTLAGPVGSITVKGNIREASVGIVGVSPIAGLPQPLGSLSIGGSLIGGIAENSGRIVSASIGTVKIGGDLEGGSGQSSGALSVDGKITTLTVGGSLIGGQGSFSARILAGELGTVKIGRDLHGGTARLEGAGAADSGVIQSLGKLGSLTIGGSLWAGFGMNSAGVKVGGAAGTISVGGSLLGSAHPAATGSAVIEVTGKLSTLSIGGSIVGGVADFSAGIVAGTLENATIRGDVRGGLGEQTGLISADAIGNVSIGGSLVGGFDPDRSDATLSGLSSGGVLTGGAIARLSIGGDIQGGSGQASGGVAALGGIGAIVLGGSLIGGTNSDAGSIFSEGRITSLQIAGDVLGGSFAQDTGQVVGRGGIGKAVIGGSVIGGQSASGSGWIEGGSGRIDSLTIGGDLRGGTVNVASAYEDTGAIHARQLGAITIGGSVFAGVNVNSGTLIRAGWISADEDLGSLTVKGSLIGNERLPVLITAGGKAPVAPTIAKPEAGIGALTIGGNVDHTFVLAGYNKNGIGVSADASVGAVKVGGDWIGSYLTAGVEPGADLIFGTADDRLLLGGSAPAGVPIRDNLSVSKIASIVIGGQIKSGQNDGLPFDGNQTYAFVAQQIGSFKYDGIVVPLTAGASNDTFALGKARPLGASRSSLNTDGFAMHVFEI